MPDDIAPAKRPAVIAMVTDAADAEAGAVLAKLWRLRDHCGYLSRAELGDPPARFAPPSDYSLPAVALAAHIRRLRRSGWQSWEIRTRFDFREAA